MIETPHLKQGNENLRKRTVTVILENSEGKILLQLRDNKPEIPFPNHWYLPGGGIEESDPSPEEAIRREIEEEMGLSLENLKLLTEYKWDDKDEYTYHARADIDVARVVLTEGQDIRYFSRQEITGLDLAFHDGEILKDYFEGRISASH